MVTGKESSICLPKLRVLKLNMTNTQAGILEETLSDLLCHGSAHKAIYTKDLELIRNRLRGMRENS